MFNGDQVKKVAGVFVIFNVVVGCLSMPPGLLNIPIKFGHCINPPVSPGFKAEQFFSGKWYNWKDMGSFFFGASNSCTATDTRIDGSDVHILHYHYDTLSKSYYTIEGESNLSYMSLEGLWFPVEYNIFQVLNIEIPFSIVATDYNNWAVVYFCRQNLFFTKLEMSWILMRQKNAVPDEKHLKAIKSAIHTMSWSLSDFVPQDNSLCNEKEPHL